MRPVIDDFTSTGIMITIYDSQFRTGIYEYPKRKYFPIIQIWGYLVM